MNATVIDCTPLQAAACKLLIATMRAGAGATARFDYRHINPRLGALIYTRIDHADLRGEASQLSTVRHRIADINARAAAISPQNP